MGPYNSSMEVTQNQLERRLDQLVLAHEHLEELLTAVAAEPSSPQLVEYTDLLLRRMETQAPINSITERPGAIYVIENYDFRLYQWFKQRDFPHGVVTPRRLLIPQGDLTPDERKQFQERLHKA